MWKICLGLCMYVCSIEMTFALLALMQHTFMPLSGVCSRGDIEPPPHRRCKGILGEAPLSLIISCKSSNPGISFSRLSLLEMYAGIRERELNATHCQKIPIVEKCLSSLTLTPPSTQKPKIAISLAANFTRGLKSYSRSLSLLPATVAVAGRLLRQRNIVSYYMTFHPSYYYYYYHLDNNARAKTFSLSLGNYHFCAVKSRAFQVFYTHTLNAAQFFFLSVFFFFAR